MEYQYYDLGWRSGGEIVEVTLSAEANVCLLDSAQFRGYQDGAFFDYFGGLVRTSPFRIEIPHGGHWFVTIDLGGYAGSVRHSCRVISPQPAPARQNTRADGIESLKWQIQDENPDCKVKVTSHWLEKHPEYGDPATERTDFLVFDKKHGNLHKHYSIGEDTNWELKEWHDWYRRKR